MAPGKASVLAARQTHGLHSRGMPSCCPEPGTQHAHCRHLLTSQCTVGPLTLSCLGNAGSGAAMLILATPHPCNPPLPIQRLQLSTALHRGAGVRGRQGQSRRSPCTGAPATRHMGGERQRLRSGGLLPRSQTHTHTGPGGKVPSLALNSQGERKRTLPCSGLSQLVPIPGQAPCGVG